MQVPHSPGFIGGCRVGSAALRGGWSLEEPPGVAHRLPARTERS
jgi:hypothetical protein